MTKVWDSSEPAPETQPIGFVGWGLVCVRGALVGGITYFCLILLLLVRVVEAPLFGLRRPITPWITQFVCKSAIRGMGIGYSVTGTPMDLPGAIVANHSSWLDIFSLNAAQRIYFVSKSEVARWPGIGWLARAVGTVFIQRRASEAGVQRNLFQERLRAGHRLVFFPEGTSSDSIRVLPFKSTLFAAFFDQDLVSDMYIQPVTVAYHAPKNSDDRFYGWWGDMTFGGHLQSVLATWRQGRIHLVFHDPVAVKDFASRKALSAYCETVIRQSLSADLAPALANDLTSAGDHPSDR